MTDSPFTDTPGSPAAKGSSLGQRAAPRPSVVILAIFLLSAPLLLLGELSRARLLPGVPLSALMFLCIALVAIWAAHRTGGWASVRGLLARVSDWRRARPRRWLVVAALLMPLVLAVEYVLMRLLGIPLPSPQPAWPRLPLLFALLFIPAACEELAWSATLCEPLQASYTALGAALIIGASWALLHVGPYLQAGRDASWILGQLLFTVAFRVVLVWLYDASGQSLFAATIGHAAYNTAWQLFPDHGSGYDPWLTAALTTVVVALAIALFGARTLTRREPSP